MKTLVILDMQNDFIPGGALAVPHGDLIIPIINRLLKYFDLIVATQDWHPPNHKSFASNHPGKKPFQTIKLNGIEQILWPDHCVQGTIGAAFPSKLNTTPIEAIFRKGTNADIDSYSGFYDNQHKRSSGLAGYLHAKGATALYFCGLCADVCVYFSLKDALAEGFHCYLIEDATCPLNEEDFNKTKKQALLRLGVKMVKSEQFIQ
ncbi:bifunctional nicotinamidase/pyrazinamidase [Legionella tunisiensis]|uniref:bifunctional nicotinamidase/pyrazinamidase n=1 Tax=Legionella tunisiensis TaxID=1034944 RepID=UPI0002D94252|nr:bifunctional nicotinamidase/pyrazinamidase [Legionella tunisiensis]